MPEKLQRELFDAYHVIESVVNSLDNLLVPFFLALFAVIHVIKIDRPDRREKRKTLNYHIQMHGRNFKFKIQA